MTAPADGLVGYVRGQMEKPLAMVGGFFKMTVLTGKAFLTRPFQWKEFVLQSWFLIRVAFLPTLAVSIPLTVLIIFTLNILWLSSARLTSRAPVRRWVRSRSSVLW